MNTNLNLLFNKTYYEYLDNNRIDDRNFEKNFKISLDEKNKALFESDFYHNDDYCENTLATHKFTLKTTYPGAIIGTGYAHGTGLSGVDNDINCGFSFDYVSGQPYYPASSVKGVLRSAFQHKDMVKSLLPEECKNVDMGKLENSIFGDDKEKEPGVDVFFDAVITFVKREDEKQKKHFLAKEYITPHSCPTDNPIPIMLLKILPNVFFEFNFKLEDSVVDEITITKETKKQFFKDILLMLGIGAKTNVGFGALVKGDLSDDELQNDNRAKDIERLQRLEAQEQQNSRNGNGQRNQGGNGYNGQRNNQGGNRQNGGYGNRNNNWGGNDGRKKRF